MRHLALIILSLSLSLVAAEGRRTAFVGGLVVGAVAGAVLEASCDRRQEVVRQEVVYVERPAPQVVYVERPAPAPQVVYVERPAPAPQVVYVERPAPQVVYVERRPTVSVSVEIGSRRHGHGCGWVPPVAHPFPQGR